VSVKTTVLPSQIVITPSLSSSLGSEEKLTWGSRLVLSKPHRLIDLKKFKPMKSKIPKIEILYALDMLNGLIIKKNYIHGL
jgi:hypothetical protein